MPPELQHQQAAPLEKKGLDDASGMKSMSPPDFSVQASGGNDAPTDTPTANDIVLESSKNGEAEESPAQFQRAGYAPEGKPAAPIQKKDAPIQRKKPKVTYVRREVNLKKKVGKEEFRRIALSQLFKGDPPKVNWEDNDKLTYDPKDNPHTIDVDIKLIKRYRQKNNASRGIGSDKKGEITGASGRAKKFHSGAGTKSKGDLMAEINRRYWEELGIKPGTQIKPGEKGKAQMWNQIRDEVLFQNEHINNLPPEVKKLIKYSTNGKKITAKDIEQLFRIAKKIEGMEISEVLEYYGRVSGSTTNLTLFEASLENFLKKKAERAKDNAARESLQTKMYGHENLYEQYKDWKKAVHNHRISQVIGVPVISDGLKQEADKKKAALEAALLKKGYKSIADFEKYIDTFTKAFQKEAQKIALDILAKYESRLYKEGERYKDDKQLGDLHTKLGSFRGNYKKAQQHDANARGSRKRSSDPMVYAPVDTPKSIAEKKKSDVALDGAKSDVKGLSQAHPLLIEDHLPKRRRLNKGKMAYADKKGLGNIIQGHVAARIEDVKDARKQILGDDELVFKLKKLMPQFYEQMGIPKDGICDLIVKDKVSQIERDETIVNVILAVLAIGLAIVSFGTATPFIAAGAALGGLAVSTYFVYEEFTAYVKQNDLAAVGFAEDPSLFWLIVAIGGAALDLGAAAKALKALAPAAKALNAGGDFADFVKVVNSFGDAGAIEGKIAKAAEKAGVAKAAAKSAGDDLSKVIANNGGKLKSLKDPKAYEAMVRLASAKMKQGVHSFHHYVLELKKARKIAKVAGDLSPEELAKAKEAWEQAVKLHKSAEVPVDIMNGKKVFGRFSNGSHLEVISNKVNLHGGNRIKLDPQKTTTIAGTMNDTGAVVRRGGKMPGATAMGSNPGGINILRSPKWAEIQAKHHHLLEAGETSKYWRTVTEEFWNTANKPWLDKAIKRGDNFRMVSNPTDPKVLFSTTKKGEFILDAAGNKIKSIFGREVDYLRSKGYKILADGTAVAP